MQSNEIVSWIYQWLDELLPESVKYACLHILFIIKAHLNYFTERVCI